MSYSLGETCHLGVCGVLFEWKTANDIFGLWGLLWALLYVTNHVSDNWLSPHVFLHFPKDKDKSVPNVSSHLHHDISSCQSAGSHGTDSSQVDTSNCLLVVSVKGIW